MDGFERFWNARFVANPGHFVFGGGVIMFQNVSKRSTRFIGVRARGPALPRRCRLSRVYALMFCCQGLAAIPQGLSKVLEEYEMIVKGGERWMSHRLCLTSLKFSESS